MLRTSTSVLRMSRASLHDLRNFATVPLSFLEKGEKIDVDAKIGDSILEVAHANDIEMEGACGGETACSTCHVILNKEFFDKLKPPSEEEEDMLDLALGLTKTSRLGCQIKVEAFMKGQVIELPKEVMNNQKDD